MSPFGRSAIFFLFAVLVGAATSLHGATLFSETFDGESIGQSTGTWRGYNSLNISGGAYGGVGITTGTTAPTGATGNPYLYAQNNTPAGATTTVDYFLFTTAATSSAGLFTSLVPADFSEFKASWQQNTGGTMSGMSYHMTVLVNDVWYASTSAVSDTSGTNLYSLDFQNAAWYEVTYVAGGSMSLSLEGSGITTTDLFGSGEAIDGIGFYVRSLPGASPSPATDYRTIRFDNLTVTGVPEPGRAALLGFALASLMLRRRR